MSENKTQAEQKQKATAEKQEKDLPAFEIRKDGSTVLRKGGLTLINYPGAQV